MIHRLQIRNFKSIKDLTLDCRQVNVFIGEPNAGKSNILEALALYSQGALGTQLNQDIFRFKTVGSLFYDFNFTEPIELHLDDQLISLKYAKRQNGSTENLFEFRFGSEDYQISKMEHSGKVKEQGALPKTSIRYYNFQALGHFVEDYLPHLSPPSGSNLPIVLLSNAEARRWVSAFLRSKGLKLTMKPNEMDIEVSKLVDDEIYSYPYFSLSQTLQRVIFFMTAISTNKESVLLFDEPDSNTFPFYTKQIAERIALDVSNQFFITTHNPYLLVSLIEKSGLDHINVCLTQMKDHQTTISVLNEEQISEVLDLNSDVFFNFDRLMVL